MISQSIPHDVSLPGGVPFLKLQDGTLPVLNGVVTNINGLVNEYLELEL